MELEATWGWKNSRAKMWLMRSGYRLELGFPASEGRIKVVSFRRPETRERLSYSPNVLKASRKYSSSFTLGRSPLDRRSCKIQKREVS